jgi:Xaa-Pro aminopeptidase
MMSQHSRTLITNRNEEIKEKERRIMEFLERNHLDALLMNRRENFAWFTCGGDNHVVSASEFGVASLIITPKQKYVLTSNIEAQRILDEELIDQDFEMIRFPWYELDGLRKGIRKIGPGMRIGSDILISDTDFVGEKLRKLRCSLTTWEIDRYKWLGKKVAECLSKIAREIQIGDTEHEMAAGLASELIRFSISPSVILIATDERIFKYRHPIPTERKLERYAMLVVNAEKWGLVASLTRLVHFDKVPSVIRKKMKAVAEVDACFIQETRPGNKYSDIFAKGVETYQKVGFGEEWKFHHQGGPTGYQPREYLVTQRTTGVVLDNQAVAWNPSITGTKLEDTIIATAKGSELLTVTPKWPTLTVEYKGAKIQRPDILIR